MCGIGSRQNNVIESVGIDDRVPVWGVRVYQNPHFFPLPLWEWNTTLTALKMRTNQRKDFTMKIHVRPQDFVAKFRLAASVVATTDIAPIHQFVKMTADKEKGVTLQATDGEVAIRLGVDCNGFSQDGEALLPSKRLLQILDATD